MNKCCFKGCRLPGVKKDGEYYLCFIHSDKTKAIMASSIHSKGISSIIARAKYKEKG
jgi:hypothetical protein